MSLARRAFCATAVLVLAAAASAQPVLKPGEQARIERLIGFVEGKEDLRFVRNGKAYDCKDAARFLREKFKAMGGEVTTAEDFIERIATRSSMSGRNYLIRWPDGREQPSGEYLRGELKRLDAQRSY